MTYKISKWGNSSAIRLPKSILAMTGMKEGTPVEFILKDSGVLLLPKEPKKQRPTLDFYLKLAKKKGHHKMDWGRRVGKEIFW